jgi:hypothetical protein
VQQPWLALVPAALLAIAENRLTAPDELFRLLRELEALERRIAVHTRSSDASSGDAGKRTSANDGGRTEE